jgi:hypothetical protein
MLKACRAYFTFEAGNGSGANGFTFDIDFGDGTNAIQHAGIETQTGADIWYDLSGRRLHDKPQQKGIYVTGGKKAIIK